MRKLLLVVLTLSLVSANAQVYFNEWIDYSKTYYKFKLAKDGLMRIPQSTLVSAGLGSVPAEQFQLWRNGEQVPVYSTRATGVMTTADYLEFYGRMNDGRPDRNLYRNPAFQLNDKYSLESDTAVYFLTVNPATASNKRLVTTANNVTGTTLTPDPYFMYKAGKYYKDNLNPGYAVPVGEYLYSSSYDIGEGWTSGNVETYFNNNTPSYGSLSFDFQNLHLYNGGPAPKFKIGLSGNTQSPRKYKVTINGDSVISQVMDYFNYAHDSTNFNLSTLSAGHANVVVTNQSYCSPGLCPSVDRLVVHKFEITYPRQFDFDNASNFEFTLAPSATGNFIRISNFNSGSATPVLYDLTSGKRYVADMSAAPILQFVLDPSTVSRSLVLVSEVASNVGAVTGLVSKTFINFANQANQGNYLIISHPYLQQPYNGVDQVTAYAAYRQSAAGGSYNSKIYMIDELIDQFGYGINRNPIAVRNFLYWARQTWTNAPKHALIIGRGVNYTSTVYLDNNAAEQASLNRLALVPTFGFPASDILLAADPGSSQPKTSIGRLSVISSEEVYDYLKKVKDYELAQQTSSPVIADKIWMKNVMHVVGAAEPGLDSTLGVYMKKYANVIKDTLFGANVTLFSKKTTDAIQQANNSFVQSLISGGLSLITYFGHSSTTNLEFNLDNPESYQNTGKYPLFIGLGCNAGNFYNYYVGRLYTKETLSEKWVLAKDKGTIGFIASSYFGIVYYLEAWNDRAYQNIAYKNYGKSIGEIMEATITDVFSSFTQQDFYARCNSEQSTLHGDPAVVLNPHPKPDYAIEASGLRISPNFVSVADHNFKVSAKVFNLGRAISKPVVVEIQHIFPGGLINKYRDTLTGLKYADSLELVIPIDQTASRGQNRIIFTVDPDNQIAELYETNNSVTKDFMIYEDEARPIYPFDYSIVNQGNVKFLASTANPFSASRLYRMEIDTTINFNSPIKASSSVTSVGGILTFTPSITLADSTVYYWRVAVIPTTGSPIWNTASFVYLSNSQIGFNQSHFYQHLESEYHHIDLDASRKFAFDSVGNSLLIRNALFGASSNSASDFIVSVNGNVDIKSACVGSSLIFNVFNPKSFKPEKNTTGRYGSALACDPFRQYNFEFQYTSPASRKKMMDFMDSIPAGSYVVVRNIMNHWQTGDYISDWAADESLYGTGNSLYHKLKGTGFSTLDSFYRARAFIYVYQKGNSNFPVVQAMSQGIYDIVQATAVINSPDSMGTITSPLFGPAKQWNQFIWRGDAQESNSFDETYANILGVRANGSVDTLISKIPVSQVTTNISGINTTTYPYLQIQMTSKDTSNYTPHALRYWRVTGTPVPEGAVAPNLFFSIKDTVDVGEPVSIKIAFKNISPTPFDSVLARVVITDPNNVIHYLPGKKFKPLNPDDTVHIKLDIDTKLLVGSNFMYVEVNPDMAQPEEYHFNNYAYKGFYVRADTLHPLLDVTFDKTHILNNDIVSAKPEIVINLKDESKWYLLDDPSTISVKVKFPDNSVHSYAWNSDTLQFVPATQVPNANNSASAIFRPHFPVDGTYELSVQARDMSQNSAGNIEYKVNFQVINKAMISNMLNYPNPFTTSTAFVFTLTGSQVPQNIRIQIMTVTGKVVREITKDELGPLKIGRNITEFKWDGTDQYGQKLANGVYLYRVITNLNGQGLEKFRSETDNTDQYFNKGYGKMYLMR